MLKREIQAEDCEGRHFFLRTRKKPLPGTKHREHTYVCIVDKQSSGKRFTFWFHSNDPKTQIFAFMLILTLKSHSIHLTRGNETHLYILIKTKTELPREP